jgi:uncharacterized protein (TIRG00374 family)
VVTCAVLAIVVWRVLPAVADYSQAWSAIRRMSAGGLTALAVTIVANVALFTWPLQTCLPGLSYAAAFVARQTSFMIANTVPAGGAFALGVQYGVLADAGIATAPATAAITLTGVWNLLTMLALPALGAAMLLVGHGARPQWVAAAGVGFAGIAVLAVLLRMVLRDEAAARRVGAWLERVGTRALRAVRSARVPRLTDRLVAVRAATIDLLRTRPVALTISSFTLHVLQFAILLVTVRALQGPDATTVTAPEVFAAIAFARLATFVPLTPNGLGTVDAGLAGLLVAFGAPGDQALAAVLVWRVATTLPQVAIGSGTFLYWRHRMATAAVGRRHDALTDRGSDNP